MNKWHERLREIREKRGISQGKMAREIKVDLSTISRYESGRGSKKPTEALLMKLRQYLSDDEVHYIETGEWKSDRVNIVEEPHIRYGSSDTVQVSVMSVWAAAGGGNHVESIDEWESGRSIEIDRSLVPGARGTLRAIEVDGDSMVPVLLPGSWVIWEESHEWSGDGLYILVFRGVLMVKRVEAEPATGNLWIRSANPSYRDHEYNPTEDQSTMRLVGRVVRCVV